MAYLDDSKGHREHAGRAGHLVRREGRLPPRRHLSVLRPVAGGAPPPDRRGADVHRWPLHDGPPRCRRGGEAGGRRNRDPLPLQHLPTDRDRRPGVRIRRQGGGRGGGHRAGAWPEPRGVTHAIVLIGAERSALRTLGGALADIAGVAEAYSVTGEWDFVAILRVRQQAQLAELVTGAISQLPGVTRTPTMVAFEASSRHDLEALFSVGQ